MEQEVLKPWERLGIPEDVWKRMSETERVGRWRQGGLAAPPQKRRPESRSLTEAELDTIKDLPLNERLAKGRAMQQQPLME